MTTEAENQMQQMFLKSENSRETELTMFGDRNIQIQIVTLLAYIRNAIKSNAKKTISVEIGNNIANGEFEFLVKNTRVDDLICKDKIEIN